LVYSRGWIAGLLILLLFHVGCAEPDPGAVEKAERDAISEIEALLESQGDDWSRGDLESFTGIYADNCVYISPSGMVEGREALLRRYRDRYPDEAARGTLTLDIIEVRPAFVTLRSLLPLLQSSDIGGASVVARWTLSYPDRDASTGLTLLVFRRIDGQWRIVHDASL
jgi:ketosteroid isomerase-like protein